MHAHPASVGVCLTDLEGRFTFPDGSTEEIQAKAGEAAWFEATEHLPENSSNQPLEMILIELK